MLIKNVKLWDHFSFSYLLRDFFAAVSGAGSFLPGVVLQGKLIQNCLEA